MKIFQRPCSIIKENEELKWLCTFKNFPIKQNCVAHSDHTTDLFLDMQWGYTDSGNIELMNLVDPDLIYLEYHNPGTVGKTWREHHRKLFEFMSLDHYYNVLEIGGSSGRLLENFCATDKNFSWTMIEPSVQQTLKDNRVKFVQGFFEKYNFEHKFDTVVHSHCFEHSYNPLQWLTRINELLEDGGVQYISIPNMKYALEHGFLNMLNFEHTFYIDEIVAEYLLNKTGFEVLDIRIDNHSILIKSRKITDAKIKSEDFSYIKFLFENYVSNIKKDIELINLQVQDKPFYLFGAHVFAQYLINFGLKEKQIINLLDNDIAKHNKRLYGTQSWVKSPSCLKDLNEPIVILRVGAYFEEIKDSLLEINSTIKII
jgi:hypothetical protein